MTRSLPDGPAAVLIDLDGTLVRTVDVWRAAYLRLGAELGVTLPDGFWGTIAGRSMQDSLRVLGPVADAHDADALIERLVGSAAEALAHGGPAGWTWMPGALGLLDALWGATSPAPATALVTSAWHAFTDPLLEAALVGRPRTFDAVVCGDDVERGKPSPDPYLRAAALLDVDPADCLVIEDSPTGVAAAEAAGMVVLVVPHAGTVPPAPGREIRTDLVGLTVQDLAAVHARLRSDVRA